MSRTSHSGPYFQDYTHSGVKHFEETDIYHKAISIGERRVIEDNPEVPPEYDRRVVRNVQVPYNRQVRVPTVETRVVPSTTRMKIPVKKIVEVPTYRVVDEEYTEWEDQERVRDKEIWVKQIVQEKYIEKVPVKRTRQVRVPHKELQEVEELEEVEVPTTKAVEVQGYRIDEVQDSKIVEVEETERMAWHSEATGDHTLIKTEEGPTVEGPHFSRKVGNGFYQPGDPKLRNVELDNQQRTQSFEAQRSRPSSANHSHQPFLDHKSRYGINNHNNDNPLARTRPMSASFYNRPSSHGLKTTARLDRPHTLNPSQPMLPMEEARTSNGSYGYQTSYKAANGWFEERVRDPRQAPSAGEYSSKQYLGMERAQALQRSGAKKSKGIGMTVKSTATAHTDSYGVVITKIVPGSQAAKAGLRVNDIIVQCEGRPTTSVEELGGAIKAAQGAPLEVQVNRDGRRGVKFTVLQDA